MIMIIDDEPAWRQIEVNLVAAQEKTAVVFEVQTSLWVRRV